MDADDTDQRNQCSSAAYSLRRQAIRNEVGNSTAAFANLRLYGFDSRRAWFETNCATCRPIRAPTSSEVRKWIPEYTRASITSSAASPKVVQRRVTPDKVTTISTPGLSSKTDVRILAIALLFAVWPDGYSGCGGVPTNGNQIPSPSVASLPSKSPFLIAA